MEDEPPPADVAVLADRLHQHNAAVTGWDNGCWLTIFVRNEADDIVAGLHGWTWGQTGFVQTLWVREDLRGGLGARLLVYRHRGYEVIGELPGWPDQTTRIFLRKTLSDCPSAAVAAAQVVE